MSQRTISLVWGSQGLKHSAGASVCIIVDVLSFSSAVDAACSAGAIVYPYRRKDGRLSEFATAVAAQVAGPRRKAMDTAPSLSPLSLANLPGDTRLVLPSPNGSTLSLESNAATTIAGCLRNSSAIAEHVNGQTHGNIVVVAAGERWDDGSLRPALEDFIGAGAIIARLQGLADVEASAARHTYNGFAGEIPGTILACASAQELVGHGFELDVAFASDIDVSKTVPLLSKKRAYKAYSA